MTDWQTQSYHKVKSAAHFSFKQAGARLVAVGVLLLLTGCLVGCGTGNNGGVALAFVRNGALYRLQPDGSTLYQIASGHIIGFAWAPDHHSLVFRYATTSATTTAPGPLPTETVPDVAAAFGVVSIDGGNVIEIAPQGAVVRDDAVWNMQGNRLLYRERYGADTYWFQSQNDQQFGIARKQMAHAAVIPATAPDGSQWAVVNATGQLMVGTYPHLQALPDGPTTLFAPPNEPARLEWQPHASAILVAVPGTDPGSAILRRYDLTGANQDVATVNGLDNWAFAPNGQQLLWHDAAGYDILSLATGHQIRWAEQPGMAWWSPDGASVLLTAADHASLVDAVTGKVTVLARWTPPAATPIPAADALPATGSPWSGDSHQFALALPGGTWLANGTATTLATRGGTGTGIYLIDRAALTMPAPIDWGEHRGLSWSTPDPNTQWLAP